MQGKAQSLATTLDIAGSLILATAASTTTARHTTYSLTSSSYGAATPSTSSDNARGEPSSKLKGSTIGFIVLGIVLAILAGIIGTLLWIRQHKKKRVRVSVGWYTVSLFVLKSK